MCGFHGFSNIGRFNDVSTVVYLQHSDFGGFGGNGNADDAFRHVAGRFVRIRFEFHVDSRSISTASHDADFRCGLMRFGWALCARTWRTTHISRLLEFQKWDEKQIVGDMSGILAVLDQKGEEIWSLTLSGPLSQVSKNSADFWHSL